MLESRVNKEYRELNPSRTELNCWSIRTSADLNPALGRSSLRQGEAAQEQSIV